MEKQPIPRIRVYNFCSGRGYRRRTRLAYEIKFPCLPSRWSTDLNESQYHKLIHIVKEYGYKTTNLYEKKRWWLPEDIETSDEILKKIFGLNTIQCFNRWMRDKRRIAYKNRWVMWCIPVGDARKVLYRYRSNQWNKSEHILKEYQWLFSEILPQFDGILNEKKSPNYYMLDVGPDRKPMLYVCNICGREALKEEWRWDRPAGFASHHYIVSCPQCKSKGSDLFQNLFDKPSEFRPYSRMQDDYLFTF